MAKKPTIKVDFLLGVSKAGVYDSGKNVAVQTLQEHLAKALTKMEKDILKESLDGLQEQVIADIQKSLKNFMGQMVTVFMRQQFSLTGAPREISEKEVQPDIDDLGDTQKAPGMNSYIVNKISLGADKLLWPGLAQSTIKRKITVVHAEVDQVIVSREVKTDANGVQYLAQKKKFIGGTRSISGEQFYFRWTGELATQIRDAISQMLFGSGGLIDPKVTFTRTDQEEAFTPGKRLGEIRVRILRRGMTGFSLMEAFKSGDFSQAADDQKLLSKFMDANVADKLGRSSRSKTNNKRPWVGPSIAYWMINRLPYVIEHSIRKTIQDHKAAAKAAAAKKSDQAN
jgi:hypothetical protein